MRINGSTSDAGQEAQCRCAATENAEENIARAEALVRKAAAEGAQIILLPELFERPVFLPGAQI